MVEGQDLAQVESYATEIADAVRAALGAGSAPPAKTAAVAPQPIAARA
jgi:hypothetical protein